MTDETKTPAETEGTSSGGKKTQINASARGNLASDIVLRKMGSDENGADKFAASFTIMTAESYQKDGKWEKRAADGVAVNVTNQGQVAELRKAMDAGLGKGGQIAVEGTLNQESWKDAEGNDRYAIKLVPRGGKTAIVTEFPDKENGRKDYAEKMSVEANLFLVAPPEVRKTADGKEFVTGAGMADYGYKDQQTGEFVTKKTTLNFSSFSPKVVAAAKASLETGEMDTGALVQIKGRLQSNKAADGRYFDQISLRYGEDGLKVLEPNKKFREAQAEQAQAKEDEAPAKASKKAPAKKKKSDRDEIPF